MPSIIITLRRDRIYWELVSPSGVVLTRFKEKYRHMALERANAFVSSWNDWVVRIEDETRLPEKTDRQNPL